MSLPEAQKEEKQTGKQKTNKQKNPPACQGPVRL